MVLAGDERVVSEIAETLAGQGHKTKLLKVVMPFTLRIWMRWWTSSAVWLRTCLMRRHEFLLFR